MKTCLCHGFNVFDMNAFFVLFGWIYTFLLY